jgi:predicted outer membrane repeat protein
MVSLLFMTALFLFVAPKDIYAADITVTNTNDSGAGSLRQAIIDAFAGNEIDFSVAGTITLTTGNMAIAKNLTITGPGADRLTISGNNSSRIFTIATGTVNISGVTIANGNTSGSGDGGGVYVSGGTVTFTNCTFDNNSAIGGYEAGALAVYGGTISCTGCTFTNNSASYGGAISITGAISGTFTNCTFSGNSATDTGGAITTDGMSLLNCTVAYNSATIDIGGIEDQSSGISITNTIVSNNNPGAGPNTDLLGIFHSGGYNIIGSTAGGFITWNAGTGDQLNTDPTLNALANNGGTTQTHSLQGGSPALNPASSNGAPAIDQRGYARNGNADTGAFEASAVEPEINITGNAVPIADGDASPTTADHTDFGSVVTAGGTQDRTFTIANSGSANLAVYTVLISGTHAADFSVTAQPATPVASGGGTTTFTVRFDPSADGLRSAIITLANNDSSENPYNFNIQGTGSAATPEIALSQGATPIADGGSHGFGSQVLSSNTDLVFTVTNSGTANLTLTTPITLGGVDPGQFSIQAQPSSPVASGGGTTTFTVRFTPTSTGAKSATIALANNDGDENPYNLTITGTGTESEMALSQGATPIGDGGSHGFGSQLLNSNTDLVFTITNSGTANLTLTTPITVGGTDPGQFSIQAQPSSPVASGGGTTTFTIRFTPTSTGAKSATIAIANNDSNENPYNLTVTGTGTAPEMALNQGATPIADGGSHDFGSQLLSSNTDLVFTITNSGTANLTLTTPITLGGVDPGQFSIQAQPTSPVASGGGTTTFTVRFTPTSAGAKSATIAIANNDDDENPYNLSITGTGTAPEMALSQGATPIGDGGSHSFGSQVLSSNTDLVFTVTNSGTANLSLTTPLTLGGTDSGQFSIQAQPSSPVVSGGGTTTFTVRFTPTSAGAKSATIAIANNDGDENPYNLTITGTGTAPEMALSQGATPIADGGSQLLSSNTDLVFTITNSGTANLTLTTPITLGGTDSGQFSIQAQPTSPVASGGGSTTFTVRFTPTSTGAKSATIVIANNDTDENPYNLTVTGNTTGTVPTVTTDDVTSIQGNNAVSGGNITDDGGVPIIERGVCWSNSPTPTTSDDCLVETVTGDGLEPYSMQIPELQTSNTYYVRAFATNSIGTAYGSEKTFKTKLFFYLWTFPVISQGIKTQ